MRVDILSIFPSFFDSIFSESLLKKAIEARVIDIQVHDIREYTKDKHRRTDDEPYGGGAGMVMTPQPIVSALEAITKDAPARRILLTPRGKPFRQSDAVRLSKEKRLLFVCGRYEGVDQRVTDGFIDEEISLGDFVLNGGEIAAAALVESIFRLLPGAVGNSESLETESFERGLLEYPHYTRPEDFQGMKVPDVLLSGHHKKIENWRREESLKQTAKVRPDLLSKSDAVSTQFSIALVHYPVLGKDGQPMVGSITTIDVHDMARIGRTYGARSVFIITPVEDQKIMVDRLKSHWIEGDFLKGEFERRVEALDIMETAGSVEIMLQKVKKRSKKVKILATSAIESPSSITPEEWRAKSCEADEWVILFGTAYGLAPELMEMADYQLSPIEGAGEFNHLPVRGASAIITDSLFGKRRRPGDERDN